MLRVIDSGIGIPEAEQSHLFSRFFRSSTARQRAIQGTGLGLSIVQSTVEGHGGRVELLSRHQVGTTVTVVLPRRTPGGSTSAPSGSLVDSVSSGSPAGAPSEGVLR